MEVTLERIFPTIDTKRSTEYNGLPNKFLLKAIPVATPSPTTSLTRDAIIVEHLQVDINFKDCTEENFFKSPTYSKQISNLKSTCKKRIKFSKFFDKYSTLNTIQIDFQTKRKTSDGILELSEYVEIQLRDNKKCSNFS